MSTHAPDNDGTVDDSERRFAELTLGDDELVIYDRENHRAWLQSDVAVQVEERC